MAIGEEGILGDIEKERSGKKLQKKARALINRVLNDYKVMMSKKKLRLTLK